LGFFFSPFGGCSVFFFFKKGGGFFVHLPYYFDEVSLFYSGSATVLLVLPDVVSFGVFFLVVVFQSLASPVGSGTFVCVLFMGGILLGCPCCFGWFFKIA